VPITTGDKTRLGRITKMGDRYLRNLVVGARATLRHRRGSRLSKGDAQELRRGRPSKSIELMSKSAQANRQTLFFILDRYNDNKAWPEGRGEASRRQKERRKTLHRPGRQTSESSLSKRIALSGAI
jgi:hypothetical protein